MKHAHAILLEKLYADFAKGDLPSVLAACDDQITFQVPGQSRLAGKYTKQTFADFAAKRQELAGNPRLEVHDILASERHAVALVSFSHEQMPIRSAHVWRFEGGKPVAWYEYPRDLYQFDAIWK